MKQQCGYGNILAATGLLRREGKGSSVLLSSENRWEACIRVCTRSCAQVQYAKYAFRLCVCVCSCMWMHLSAGPRGAQVQSREICRVGRVDVTNAWYLDTCKVSVSPLAQYWTVITGKNSRGSQTGEKYDLRMWQLVFIDKVSFWNTLTLYYFKTVLTRRMTASVITASAPKRHVNAQITKPSIHCSNYVPKCKLQPLWMTDMTPIKTISTFNLIWAFSDLMLLGQSNMVCQFLTNPLHMNIEH